MTSKRELTLSITASVLLHLVLILLLLLPVFKERVPPAIPEEPQYQNVELISDASKEEELKEDEKLVDISLEPWEVSGKNCTLEKSTYVGIGIVYSLMDNTIISAPKDYPAGIAGIKEGDIVVSSKDMNGYRDIVIMRDGVDHRFHLKMQPICYSE